jgi:hypothetical protein
MLLRRRALRNYEQSIGSRTNSYDQPVTIDFVLGEYNGDSLLAFSQAGLESIIKVGDDGTLKSTTSNSWLIWNCGHFWTSSYRRFAIQIKSLKGSALMATTIKTSFQEFASNLEITDRQTNLVSERRGNVVDALGKKLTLYSTSPSKLIGAYDRNTLIRPLSEGDVDVMVILNYRTYQLWDTSADGTIKWFFRTSCSGRVNWWGMFSLG